MFKKSLLVIALSSVVTSTFANDADIAALKSQLKAQQAQIDALVAAIESPVNSPKNGVNNTTIGGYGEAQYFNFDNATQKYDAQRFVLYVGHQFNEKVRLHSELEVEHGLVRDNPTGSTNLGEVELEQMFIEWNYVGKQNVSVGQMLIPIGFLNETHEPDTFYGVTRNPVERNIIPTTWWEGAIKANGLIESIEGLSYNALVSTGLKTTNATIRSGRQKGSKVNAEDLAYTVGLNYRGIAGLEAGMAYQLQKDITQGTASQNNEATLIEVHLAYAWQQFSARALYAQWNIDDLALADAHKAKQDGYYLEAAYKPIDKLGVFARFSAWDNEADNTTANNKDSKKEQWNYGVNYYLTPRVVFKLDIQDQQVATTGIDEDGFALGMGYSF